MCLKNYIGIEENYIGSGSCEVANLVFVIEGTAYITVGKEKFVLQKNDFHVINVKESYSIISDEATIISFLRLSSSAFNSVYDGINYKINCSSVRESQTTKVQLIRELIWELLRKQSSMPESYDEQLSMIKLQCSSIYHKLLEILVINFGQPLSISNVKISEKNKERTFEIMSYLNEHYMENIVLEDIANSLFLSIGYLSRFFKKIFGMNFSDYLKDLRLRHAVDEIKFTKKTITQIAIDNGFSNSSFFNKSFKEKYGKTPSEIRKEISDYEISTKSQNENSISKKVSKIIQDNTKAKSNPFFKYEVDCFQKSSEKLNQSWNSILNIGTAVNVLNIDMKEHIGLLHSKLKYKYGRIWNPFSEVMFLDINRNEEKNNFFRLDLVFDTLLEIGMKPFVVFEPKIERINYNLETVIVREKPKNHVKSIEVWTNFISSFMKHISKKYGKSEIDSWIIEFPFNGYVVEGKDSLDSYISLYVELFRIVRKYSKGLKVGGPTLPVAEGQNIRNILKEFSINNLKPDFLSFICFAYEVDTQLNRYTDRSSDQDYLKKNIEKFISYFNEFNFLDIPIYITEWNHSISDRNVLNDSCYQAAYIFSNLINLNNQIKCIGYYSGSDRRSQYFDSSKLLQGSDGLISKDGIMKPSGYAIDFLNKCQNYVIFHSKYCMVTTDHHDKYTIMIHNKKNFNNYYYSIKEGDLTNEDIKNIFDENFKLNIEIKLFNIKNGNYKVRCQKINSKYGSVLDLWKELNYESSLKKGDIDYIKRLSIPRLVIENKLVENNSLFLKNELIDNEIQIIEIEPEE